MDENDKFRDINRAIESFKEFSIKSKNYIKFVIGSSSINIIVRPNSTQ
jgi:hypothetical protein